VEVKVRGFHSRILLGCIAAERGFGAIVGAKIPMADLAGSLPRGIYVEKSSQLPGLDGYRARRAMGHYECCLDEEGVVYVDAEEYAASRLSRPTLDVMQRFFAWGEEQAAVVAGYHPKVAGRVRVTGNPRVDLWRKELRGIYEPRATELRRRWGPFVLLASSFAMVNNQGGENRYLDMVAQNGMLTTERGEARVRGQIAHWRDIFEAFRSAIVDVARAVPDRRVIIRPHPSEDRELWERTARSASNLMVAHDGEITPWLLAADVVLHSNCTSGVEAVLLGRPTIAFVPRENTRYDQNIPNAVSQRAYTADDLVDLVRRNLDVDDVPSFGQEALVVRRHIAALEGPLAAERLVKELEAIDIREEPLTPGRPARRSGLRLGAYRAAHLSRRITRAFQGRMGARPTAPHGEPSNAKFGDSTAAEVTSFMNRLSDTTARFTGLECFELEPNVYAIVSANGGSS
jgi:surface carbohydrate biosynthesis protein